MNNKKPDALVVLAVLFAAGILFSAISHGGGESRQDPVGDYAGQMLPSANR
jgi:hypothetical protein